MQTALLLNTALSGDAFAEEPKPTAPVVQELNIPGEAEARRLMQQLLAETGVFIQEHPGNAVICKAGGAKTSNRAEGDYSWVRDSTYADYGRVGEAFALEGRTEENCKIGVIVSPPVREQPTKTVTKVEVYGCESSSNPATGSFSISTRWIVKTSVDPKIPTQRILDELGVTPVVNMLQSECRPK